MGGALADSLRNCPDNVTDKSDYKDAPNRSVLYRSVMVVGEFHNWKSPFRIAK
jgi:hypothetical protein